MTIQTPDWVKHAVFYQIFPDRLAKSISPEPSLYQSVSLEDWEAPPTLHGYKGGNLWGIKDKLDYLQDLGITAIYLNPIFQSVSNHRYHIHDYYQIDPLLGGQEAFQELLTAAHQRDIKIILDGVFSHVGRGFFFFSDVLENGINSLWVNWFKIEDWPLSAYDGSRPANYACWADNRSLPQLNHNNPEVREYLMQVAEHWTRQGIDGWRLDAPETIESSGFWQEFRKRIKAINPEAYLVGEIVDEANQWLDGTQFDGVMNYLFRTYTIAFVVGDLIDIQYMSQRDGRPIEPLDAKAYAKQIRKLLDPYPRQIQLTQLNLLSSHDTARLITIAGGDHPSVELATLLMFTFPGAPNIYYGDEVGLPGGLDPDCRRGFPSEAEWNLDILSSHRQLIALRHRHPALRIGDYQILLAQDMVYVFARSWKTEKLIIAVNAGIERANARIEQQEALEQNNTDSLMLQPLQVLYGSGEVRWLCKDNKNVLELVLPPRSGLIIG